MEFPLPSPYLPTNFDNSAGLRYEAMEVKFCLQSNRKESDIMPLSHTQITMEIMEDVSKQLGSAFVQWIDACVFSEKVGQNINLLKVAILLFIVCTEYCMYL